MEGAPEAMEAIDDWIHLLQKPFVCSLIVNFPDRPREQWRFACAPAALSTAIYFVRSTRSYSLGVSDCVSFQMQ
eukprot:COSAG02_NODE_538_length_20609_cov_7.009703_20_plen_74_part_00